VFLINYFIRHQAFCKLNNKNAVVTCPYFIHAVYFVQKADDKIINQSETCSLCLRMKHLLRLTEHLPFSLDICVIIGILTVGGPGSSVGIATGYGLDAPGNEKKSRCGRDFPHLSRPALGPTQPPVH
jgi:hypothetical protein